LSIFFTPTPTQQNGQTFTTVNGGILTSIDITMRHLGSPLTGDIVMDIYATTAGVPTGAPLVTSDDFDISALTNVFASHSIVFSTPIVLSPATTYAFIIRNGTSAPSGSIEFSRNTAGSYAGGNLYAYDGVTFSSVPAHDMTPFAVNTAASTVSRPHWNELQAGPTWATVPASADGKFIAMYIIATNSVEEPIIAIMGQREDDSLALAQANNTIDTLALDGLPTLEFKALYRIIYETSLAYGNAIKARQVDVVDLRFAETLGSGGTIAPTDHNALSGRSAP